MTTQELTLAIFNRIKKFRFIILIAGIVGAACLSFLAMRTPVTYTSKASVFPLNSGSDVGGSASALSALFGGSENSKSFTDDASINIIELAQSRTTREEVAAVRDASQGNKTIAELLLDDINNHRGLLEPEVKLPSTEKALINWASGILNEGLNASINKNNSFVLTYTGRSAALVKTVSYGFIDKISTFYIDLKREKAKRDFEFATNKVDSLRSVMNAKDNQLIAIDKKTLFTNTSKLEFRVPTENLIVDKQMVRQQYATAVANQQNAAYKLQKATPVIRVLDKPEPPYDKQFKSPVVYGAVGFFAGFILTVILLAGGLLLKFLKDESRKAIFGDAELAGTTAVI